MQMIPSAPAERTCSDAERRIFHLFKRTDYPEALCFHSLRLSRHDYKACGELDFLVVTPKMLLVLEVKGGGVSRRSGIWLYTDRYGQSHRSSEGPFEQAQSGMYALRERLLSEIGGSLGGQLLTGFGVAVPDCHFDVESVEWDRDIILDAGSLSGHQDLASYLEILEEYWTAKFPSKRPLAPGNRESIFSLLRPDFERVPGLRVRADQLYSAMHALTEQQYHVIDLVSRNPRLICHGGAGTGKTFLAVELAHRSGESGDRVCLICWSMELAAFLRSQIGSVPVEVRSLQEEIPCEDNFDLLILDEGQDVLNFDSLEKLDRLLAGGLANGRWWVFLDPNNQAGISGHFDPEALEYIENLGAVSVSLPDNCRNTSEIVIQTRLLTAADLGTPFAGHGPPVRYVTGADSSAITGAVDECLAELEFEGVPPGDVTLLSLEIPEESIATRTRMWQKGIIRRFNPRLAGAWPLTVASWASAEEFKGFENQFILVFDVDLSAPDALNRLYVAMSRARVGLWLFVTDAQYAELGRLSEGNVSRVLEEDGEQR